MRLGRIFRRKPPEQKPASVEAMGWLEVGESLRARSTTADGMQANDAIPYYRRLIDIAFFDTATSIDDRQRAVSLATSLRQDIEAGLANSPEALHRFNEAADYHLSQVKHYGYGSLQWILDEQRIGPSDLVEFIVRPEYSDILPAYLQMQPTDTMAKIRGAVLQSLVRARKEGDDQTSLQVLHGLALSADEALPFLLTNEELTAIANSTANFEASSALVRLLIGDS